MDFVTAKNARGKFLLDYIKKNKWNETGVFEEWCYNNLNTREKIESFFKKYSKKLRKKDYFKIKFAIYSKYVVKGIVYIQFHDKFEIETDSKINEDGIKYIKDIQIPLDDVSVLELSFLMVK